MNREFTQGNTEAATDIAHTILDVNPTNEEAHWTIMSHYHRLGDRTGALHHFNVCRKIIREELDTLPGEKLNLLREKIRRDLGEKITIDLAVPSETEPHRDPLTILQDIQNQISNLRGDIQKIKDQIDSHSPSPEKELFSEQDFTSN